MNAPIPAEHKVSFTIEEAVSLLAACKYSLSHFRGRYGDLVRLEWLEIKIERFIQEQKKVISPTTKPATTEVF